MSNKCWNLRCKWDLFLLIFLLLLTNLPLFCGGKTDIFTFYPSLVRQGRWWLIFTSQFTHITWYHLLLDGIPFFLIYCALDEQIPFRRLLYVVFAGTGSLLAVTFFSKDIAEYGLRGLSGITYGIMAVSSLEMIAEKKNDNIKKIAGASILLILLGLITYELLTGKFPFEFLLFNMVGKPILVCHTGGVIGAMLAFVILKSPKLRLR